MDQEVMTIPHLQGLYDRWLDAKLQRQMESGQEGLRGLMKYKQLFDESMKLEAELEESIAIYLKLNPGVDIDSLFPKTEEPS